MKTSTRTSRYQTPIAEFRIKGGELDLAAANISTPRNALRLYRKRWGFVCLFADVRTPSCYIADTYLTNPAKLLFLPVIAALAIIWAYSCESRAMGRQSILEKIQKRRQKSWLRIEFDMLLRWVLYEQKKPFKPSDNPASCDHFQGQAGAALCHESSAIPDIFFYSLLSRSYTYSLNIYFVLYFHPRFVYLRAKQYRVEKMTQNSFRKHLSMPGMLSEVRKCFDNVPDLVVSRGITQSDCLMTGLAVFSLKMTSMLSFDQKIRLDESSVPAQNFRSLFGVDRIPSDTRVRERLDDVDPRSIRPAFKNIFASMQRGKVLENWTMLGGHYLIAIDGTGIRSSHKVKCEKCCVKNHRNGSTTYFHQMLGAAMIHPDHSVVLPLAPEPIRKEDGAKKNDCERNAAKRLLDDLRRDHPRLKAIIVEDALASNAPHITYLKNKGFRYILGAKPGDHKLLFSRFEASESKKSWKTRDKKTGNVQHFEWDNGLPLNNANSDLKVNMLKYKETDKKGETTKFSWVTDLPLNRNSVMPVMRAGRRRWAIENELFNAMKERNEYNIEHNYGHGKNHLADVFPTLTMLAFLIDQVQLLCCGLFQKARDYQKRKIYLWERIRSLLLNFRIRDWRTFYLAMSRKISKPELVDMFPSGP